jgi:signal transduction histidine kinase
MAAKLLEQKLNIAKLLINPGLLNERLSITKFQFFSLFLKYRRIYTANIESKQIDFQIHGKSFHEILANFETVGIIPHTLLDNAIKYSLKGGIIEANFTDLENSILFSISSYGPRILPEEENRIFTPFYRGQVAKKQEEEGSGYGLYISQLVAVNHLGTKIVFEQDPKQKPNFGHWTTFSVEIPLKAIVA